MLWLRQRELWPSAGSPLLASHDAETILVYQAFSPRIADPALAEQRFVEPFNLDRMSWIKPSFLWMMFRCGWATKPDQERVLGIRLRRADFDRILAAAVPSSFDRTCADRYPTREDWLAAGRSAQVRMQWDPDHHPTGAALPRRTVQLGLRGVMLRDFATAWPVEILDFTPAVRAQRELLATEPNLLETPRETEYVPAN
jgi:hypothetical protein